MPQASTIWLVSKYISAAQHGFESRLFAIAKQMKAAGRNPVIIASDSNHFGTFPRFGRRYTREIVEGCETWWIRTLKYRSTISLRRVLSWIDFELKLFMMPKASLPKPDVIVVSSLSLLTVINGLLMRRKYRCKLVFEVRDIWPLTLIEEGGFSRYNPLVLALAWIERLGYRKADCVVGTMPNLAAHVEKVAGPGRRCECIPFGFDPAFFDRQEPLPAGFFEARVPPGKFVVGYAGSIGLTNALDTIISCAREIPGSSSLSSVAAISTRSTRRKRPISRTSPSRPRFAVNRCRNCCAGAICCISPSRIHSCGVTACHSTNSPTT
jgi:hypothetical protein